MPAWHALDHDEVVDRLDTGADGLSADAAAQRLERYGPNELEAEEPLSNWAILLHQFTSPLIYILLVAAAVTVLIQEYMDTGVIVAVLVLNATVGFVQERKADRSVRSLMQLAALTNPATWTSTVRSTFVEVDGQSGRAQVSGLPPRSPWPAHTYGGKPSLRARAS